MKKINLLEEFSQQRKVMPASAAFFIGVGGNTYRDLEMHDDEAWTLTVAEFLRLCILYEALPELLPDNAFRKGKRELVFTPNQYGQIPTVSIIREAIGSIDAAAEATGWETKAFQVWFADESSIGAMELLALNDLCEYLSVDIMHIIASLLRSLGRE